MFKHFPLKTILLTLVVWIFFVDVKATITGGHRFFLYRWIHSNTSYAKNIEVNAYLLTNEQVAYMLAHPDEDIQQPSNRDLRFKYVNVVFRIRCLTDVAAWGRLQWGIGKQAYYIVDVPFIPSSKSHLRYSHVIIPKGITVIENNDLPPEPLVIEWDELYVYR